MTKREIASLAFKILGVFFIVQGISAIFLSLFVALSAQDAGYSYFLYGGWFVLGLILWLGSDGFARAVFQSDDKSPTMITRDTGVIAFTVLGYYVLTRAISPIADTLSNIYHYLSQRFVGNPSEYVVSQAITAILLIAAGLWLINRASSLAGMLGTAGKSSASE